MQAKFFHLAKWLVGLLFILSGLIKANDPLGFGYKLQEYFVVFHLGFLGAWATGFALLICTAEVLFGALLLLGSFPKLVLRGLLFTIVFFTLLTFVSAVFKVVSSCGCFGDAIPLSPWQSFFKDLVLLVLILYLFRYRQFLKPVFSSSVVQSSLFAGLFTASMLFGLLNYFFLPLIDFLPYKVGSNLPENMKTPEGAPLDEYLIRYELKNQQTGELKKMSDKDYLSSGIWKDENWKVLGEPSRKLIKKGFEPKIKDLVINDASGTDYTREILENPFYNLIIVAYNLNDTPLQALGKLNALSLDLAKQYNTRTVLLTASSPNDVEKIAKKIKLFPEVFYADAVPLKSMVRSNPGVLLLRKGTVIEKWSYLSVPDLNDFTIRYFQN